MIQSKRWTKVLTLGVLAAFAISGPYAQAQKKKVVKSDKTTINDYFPYKMPVDKPDRPLSEGMERVWDMWEANKPQENELYTTFHYTKITGLDYHNGDGTITRRDPSRVVKANGKYYVWYTHRETPTTFQGAKNANDTIPSADWDLAEIWYATSKDGFHWEEQGVAVARPPKPQPGHRSVSTPDVLFWKGKYYLYYQAFSVMSGKKGDDCPVSCAWADSPDGPWHHTNKIVLPNGPEGAWDQFSIHDPYPVVYKGKIYFYWKSDYNRKGDWIRSTGVAIGDNPLGPFKKCKLNPVISSGHETQLFRFRGGIAAVMAKDGHEARTIQYAPDGINFKIASITELPPEASGWYDPDAFTNNPDADGVTWGLCHYNLYRPEGYSLMMRVDADLTKKEDTPAMKKNRVKWHLDDYYRHGLPKSIRNKRIQQAKQDLKK